jgi:SH3 domain-containing YSC84-like protein 1
MKKVLSGCFACLVIILLALPAWGGDKEKDQKTVTNATTVLEEMLNSKSVPADLLAQARCVVVLPNVKKFGIGIGGGGGRGPISCRTGTKFDGKWSAPAMLSVGGMSIGPQVGGTSSDFVLLVISEKAVNTILDQKTKLGTDATAAAGPSGATAGSRAGADVLTYGRAEGLFAGVSLSGSSLESDKDANKRSYGREISARDIVLGNTVHTPAGQQSFITLLDTKAPARKE